MDSYSHIIQIQIHELCFIYGHPDRLQLPPRDNSPPVQPLHEKTSSFCPLPILVNKIILDYNKLSNSHYSNLGPLICVPSIRYSLFPPT